MKTSETVAVIAAALINAQKAIKFASKDTDNLFFKSKYADIANVIEAIKGPLNDNGIAFIQTPSLADPGFISLSTRLIHESGEWIEDTANVPLQKNDPQGYGSAMTYIRRYSLAAITGLYQDDDDGNAASLPAAGKANKESPKPQAKVIHMDESEVADCKLALYECEDQESLKSIFGPAYKRADAPNKLELKAAYDKRKEELLKGEK